MIVFVYMKQYILFIKENMMYQNSNENLIIFNKKIYIKIMKCKIVRLAYVTQYYKPTKRQKSFNLIL